MSQNRNQPHTTLHDNVSLCYTITSFPAFSSTTPPLQFEVVTLAFTQTHLTAEHLRTLIPDCITAHKPAGLLLHFNFFFQSS